jgi:hypothetical protein
MEYWRLRTSNARQHATAEKTLPPIPTSYIDPAALSSHFTSERQIWLQKKRKKEVQIHLEWAAHFSSNPLASLKPGDSMLSHPLPRLTRNSCSTADADPETSRGLWHTKGRTTL